MKKKLLPAFSFLLLLFTMFQTGAVSYASSVSTDTYTNNQTFSVQALATTATYPNGLAVRSGDVLVTNNTSSSGLTGHAGIITGSAGNIASIAGYGAHPALMSLSTWFAKNPNTVVVRQSNVSLAQSAGSWANNYVYQHPNATYGLLNNMLNLEEVYCSKIPWLAYYSYGLNVGPTNTIGNGYDILPYDWKSKGENNKQGFSIAAKFGSW